MTNLGGCLFNSFRFAEFSLVWFTNLSHPSHKITPVHLLQFVVLCGITAPIPNDFPTQR